MNFLIALSVVVIGVTLGWWTAKLFHRISLRRRIDQMRKLLAEDLATNFHDLSDEKYREIYGDNEELIAQTKASWRYHGLMTHSQMAYRLKMLEKELK